MTKYSFDTGTKKESLNFEHGDLFAALHSAYVDVIGNKNINNNWDLDITLSDKYDFTEFKIIREYFEENDIMNFAATTGNNIAILSTSCNVVHTYNITIKFKITNWEVD